VLLGWLTPGAGTDEHAAVRAGMRLLCGPQGRFAATGTERISRCEVAAYAGKMAIAILGVSATKGEVPAAVRRMTAAVRSLANDTLEVATLEPHVRDLLGRAPRGWESSQGLAHHLTRIAVLGAPSNWPQLEALAWRRLDVGHTQEVIGQYLRLDRGVLAITGHAGELEKPMSRLGPVVVYRASDLTTKRRLRHSTAP
jgi:hypothetical protein